MNDRLCRSRGAELHFIPAAPCAAHREQTGTRLCFRHSPELSHKTLQLSSCHLQLWPPDPADRRPHHRSRRLRDGALQSASTSKVKEGRTTSED